MAIVHAIGIALVIALATSPAHAQRQAAAECQVVVSPRALAGVREASGLALSRGAPPRLFTINDSDRPAIHVLNVDGSRRGIVAVAGATVEDWEDVTVARCASGSCLYVADIGDNNSSRRRITVYRMPEPKDGDRLARAERFDAVYPDGAHDAEAMFADAGGRLYLITKEARGAGLYAFPPELTGGRVNRLERVARIDGGRNSTAFSRITDAETSADGRTVYVRSNDALFVVPVSSLLEGRLEDGSAFSLRRVGEPQGEGVAPAANGDVYLAGEGGSRRGVGTFARVNCALTR